MAKLKIEIDTDNIVKGVKNAAEAAGKGAKLAGAGAAVAGKAISKASRSAAAKAGAAAADAGDKVAKKVDERIPGAAELRQNVATKLDENTGKLNALNEELERALDEYNTEYDAFALHGQDLLKHRQDSVATISDVEVLINSIANKPKSFDAEIEEISVSKNEFKEVIELAARDAEINIEAGRNIGAGIAGGTAVAAAAPATAMWVATTFGTASTGAAISTLSGAAASNAALAWLGGGALTAGGGGMAAGNALLALAGPVGIGIAATAGVASLGMLIKKRLELAEDTKNETARILENTASVRRMDNQITALIDRTETHRDNLIRQYKECSTAMGRDYMSLSEDEQFRLGALVNNTRSLAASLSETIGE